MITAVNTKNKVKGVRVLAVLGLLISALSNAPAPALSEPAQQAPSFSAYGRFFPETNHESAYSYWTYWNLNGGLAQQGYPISEEFVEKSDTDGNNYWVQYYERAVFEWHPTEKPENRVLLSLLGNFEYKRKYPNGAPGQIPNTSAGSVLFKETGKRVGGAFLDYWRNNGALAQQGFPISDEFTEKSSLDGKTYTVQYFERAVFEYHPEQKDPKYRVLLSQLGTLQYQRKYESNLSGLRGDIDGDGIPDKDDRCPKSPENFNNVLDEDGCRDTMKTLIVLASEKLDAYWAMVFENSGLDFYRGPDFTNFCNSDGDFTCEPEFMNAIVYSAEGRSIKYHWEFMAEYLDKVGDVAPVVMLAHTWGHLAQDLLGRLDGRYDDLDLENQADCYAGAYVGYAKDRNLTGDFLGKIENMYKLGAQSDSPWFDPQTTGTAEERFQAFMSGYNEGAATCDGYTPGSMNW